MRLEEIQNAPNSQRIAIAKAFGSSFRYKVPYAVVGAIVGDSRKELNKRWQTSV